MSGAPAEIAVDAPAATIAREAIGDSGDAWIVGGAVRDAVLGTVTEIDLAVAGSAAEAARAVATAAGGHRFELSGEFATWRVAARDGSWHLDIAELRGETIEDDLRLRDFTVNAIAVPLGGGPPIDPTGGLGDLEARRLRATSERSFADDPLRIMRAARLAAALGLEPDPGTAELARRESARAAEPAGERQLAELAAIVEGPAPERAIELLDLLGATAAVLPELEALRGVGQSANHHLDAHQHTLEVLRRMLEVQSDLDLYAGEAAPAVGRAARPAARRRDDPPRRPAPCRPPARRRQARHPDRGGRRGAVPRPRRGGGGDGARPLRAAAVLQAAQRLPRRDHPRPPRPRLHGARSAAAAATRMGVPQANRVARPSTRPC